MKTIFNFACFALLTDEWTIDAMDEPSEPEGSPRVLGFYLSMDDAMAAVTESERVRHAAHQKECEQWHSFRPDFRRQSYFTVSVNALKLRKGDGLSEIEEYLIDAARLMAQGIGGAPLLLPMYTDPTPTN